MKARLTLTLPKKVIAFVKAKAKERNITMSQYAEEIFLKYISEYEAKENFRKVS